ncbi:MAG: uncharacterized protein K0R12_435 [Gammaproteobacteria bacterium]|jgi:DNA-binding Xre family transcriptional regulator|nr:uncharacterized protein [Gammaproteobacteria bacterium]
MPKKAQSTFDREMQNPAFREQFEAAYTELLLSELIEELMQSENKSVRKLAKEVGLSPTVIQNLRSGEQEDVKLSNFINISHACGFHIILEKGKQRIHL